MTDRLPEDAQRAKRRFWVTTEVRIGIEVDVEAVSDWDGSTILEAYKNTERFREGTTFQEYIASLAVAIAQDYRIGGSDGWADFPEGTVTAHGGWPEYETITADVWEER